MALSKIFRSVFAVILTCIIALNGFTGSAFADTRSTANSLLETTSLAAINPESVADSFVNTFLTAVATVIGGATGTVAVCYTVDVIIAPFAPPVAAYLAGTCGLIGLGSGATVGGAAGLVLAHK
jgi:hypothetical protein